MSIDVNVRPTSPVMTNATVVVMNRGATSASGQGLLSISADGCFYLDGGDRIVRAMSLGELETFCTNFPSTTEDQRRILDLIVSSISTFKNGARAQ
jgi:hypothetical protein